MIDPVTDRRPRPLRLRPAEPEALRAPGRRSKRPAAEATSLGSNASGRTPCASSAPSPPAAVRAYDVIRMLSRDGRPTTLGGAIAHYGRIATAPAEVTRARQSRRTR